MNCNQRRRNRMSFSYLGLLMAAFSAIAHAQNSTGPPNILFILADDLGWNDASWNNPEVVMPNLQFLAENGVILNQSYVQAQCSPSRAALLTGIYPYRYGFQDDVVGRGQAEFLPLNLTLLPQELKTKGYSTHLVGKWHLGHCRIELTPTFRGFDTFFGPYTTTIDYFTKTLSQSSNTNGSTGAAYDLRNNLDVYFSPDTEYLTNLFSRKAVEVINNHNASVPFYLALHYTAPHTPLQVPPRYLDFYPNMTDSERKTFLAMVTAMDEGIGEVIAALRNRSLFDNTFIVFTSDNGGSAGNGGGSNFPLRRNKGSYYEGGVRVPTIAHGPNFIANPGRVSEELFHIVDWYSTLLAAADRRRPTSGVDGVNQWRVFTLNEPGNRNEFVYNIANLSNTGVFALRRGNFKLIEGNAAGIIINAQTGTRAASNCTVPPACDCELYDLSVDPTESNDIVCQKPTRVTRMFNHLTNLKASEAPPILTGRVVVPGSSPALNNGTVNYGWC